MSTVSSTSDTTTTTSTTSYSQNRNDFDTTELVEAAVEDKLARADSLETKLTSNEAKITAYEEMQTLLLAMQDSLEALRSDPSSTGSDDDVFLNRTAYLTSSTDTDADTLLSVTVEDGTDLTSHEVEILQVAKAERLGGGTQSSRTEDLSWSGSFTIGSTLDDTSTSATITVTEDMSLDDIVDAVNAETETTGVTASVITVSDGEYMIVLTGEDAATIDLADSDDGTVLQDLGVIDEDGEKADVLQEAQTAKVKIDGVTIERNTNEIDDAIDGITLTLYKAEEGNTLTLEVDNSLSDIKEQIQALVEAYNAFREFVLTNQTTADDGTADDEAVLFGDSYLRTISNTLQTALTSAIDENSLALLGITFDEDNLLELDEDTLDDALLNNLDEIETLLSYQATFSNGNLSLLRHGDGLTSAEFTLDITVDDDGNISGVSVDGDSSLFTYDADSSRIIGAEGTEYEGITLVFTGKVSQSIDVTLSQGIADTMWQAVETMADETDGTLTELVSDLEDADADLQDRIDTIEANAESYRTYLLDKYARIEAKLSEAQSVLDLLEAITNSESSD